MEGKIKGDGAKAPLTPVCTSDLLAHGSKPHVQAINIKMLI